MRDRVELAGRFGEERRLFALLEEPPSAATIDRSCGGIVEAGIEGALRIFATESSKSTRFVEDATAAAWAAFDGAAKND